MKRVSERGDKALQARVWDKHRGLNVSVCVCVCVCVCERERESEGGGVCICVCVVDTTVPWVMIGTMFSSAVP